MDNNYVPRNNPDAERALLCCCLIDPDEAILSKIIRQISPEYFYDRRHILIFEAIQKLFEAGKSIDVITVSEALDAAGNLDAVGHDSYLAGITTAVATSTHFNSFAGIVKDNYLHRKAIKNLEGIKSSIIKDGKNPKEYLSQAIDDIIILKQLSQEDDGGIHLAKELSEKTATEILERVDLYRAGKRIGIPSGVMELDRVIGGFRPGQVIVIAGRPSFGKTDLGINIIVNNAIIGLPSIFVSLETLALDVWIRVLSLFTNIYRGKQLDGKLSDFELKMIQQESDKIKELPITIVDTPSMGVADIRAVTQEAQHRIGAKLLVVDYIGLVKPTKSDTREQEIAKISAGLKSIAREFLIPVIVISQLSRAVDRRSPPRPLLSDLRDSGAIEQDADVVIFLYRPSYYDKSKSDNLDIDVAKQRTGKTELIMEVPYDRGIGRIGGKIEPEEIPF